MGFFGRLFGNKKRDKPASSSDRRRWSFTTRSSNSSKRRSYPLPSTAAYAAKEAENADKHARAVAAATAAVAEAALAAAHAAAEVVRLTHGSGRRRGVGGGGGSNRRWVNEYFAAVKIQSAFRGYLARRALRALKALVKLQALVKGHIVRKQTADMLRRMQTLVRLQARARASRSSSHSSVSFHYSTSLLNPSPRSLHSRCVSNAEIFLPIDNHSGSKRLDWLAEEEDDKILEVDTWKPRYRFNESPRKQEQQQQSLLGLRSTENSPQVRSSGSRRRSTPFTPTTTTRSEYSWGCNNTNYYYSGYHPNYMANTESYKAKARSQSAPKQRLEVSNESSGYKRSVKGECYYITEKSLDVATSPGYYAGVSGELNRNQSAKSRRGSSFLV